MPLQLSTIQPSSGTISPPEDVSLNFTLTANVGANYIMSYSLAPGNNLYFQNAEGALLKQIDDPDTAGGTVSVFNKDLRIVSKGPKAYSFIFVRVVVREGLNGDVKSCKISIS